MTLGEFLRSQRDAKQWTQPEAAQAIEIEQSYLSKLENNKAVPSADIFDKLMAAYQFTMEQINEAVQGSEFDKLKEIAVVRAFILSTKKRQDKDKRRFLLLGLLMSMLGAFLLSLGIVMHDHQEVAYHYESKGVIKLNESEYLFTEIPEYKRFDRVMKVDEDSNTANVFSDGVKSKRRLIQDPLFQRLDFQHKVVDKDLGEFFMQAVDGGQRRYYKISTRRPSNKLPFYLGVSLGAMLLIGSLSVFYISRRW